MNLKTEKLLKQAFSWATKQWKEGGRADFYKKVLQSKKYKCLTFGTSADHPDWTRMSNDSPVAQDCMRHVLRGKNRMELLDLEWIDYDLIREDSTGLWTLETKKVKFNEQDLYKMDTLEVYPAVKDLTNEQVFKKIKEWTIKELASFAFGKYCNGAVPGPIETWNERPLPNPDDIVLPNL